MSVVNIYSTMFYKVVKTFASFLAWYSLFIIAFAFSFYILLHKDNEDTGKIYEDIIYSLLSAATKTLEVDKHKNSNTKWMSAEALVAIQEKLNARMKYGVGSHEYKIAKNQAKRTVKKAKQDDIKRTCEDLNRLGFK